MVADLRVKLIAPRMWRKLVSTAEDSLTEEAAKRFLGSALSAMHNRHVGATPQLMAELADSCLRPGAAAKGPWADVQQRLKLELQRSGPALLSGRSEDSRLQTRRGAPLLFHAAPSYVVLRIALPLLEKACRDIGVSYLFCRDETVRPPIAPPYSRYQARLRERLFQLAGEDDPSMEMFWKEAAWTLAGLSGRPAPLRTAAAQLSQIDPAALALLLRLTPRLAEPQPPPERRPRPARAASPYRPALHRREGGVEGVHITRRQEEIDSILISEYANPPLLLTERVLNTGYLALHRPPHKETLRDVLVAAFMPQPLRGTLGGDFLKACWFECMSRLAMLLWQGGLRRSEFRWTEGDARGGARSHSYRLQALPESMPEQAADSHPLFRHAFLTALDWLPSFLDTRAAMRPLRGLSAREAGGRDASALGRWTCAAWQQQQMRPLWKRGGGSASKSPGPRRSPASDFGVLHLMIMMPAHLLPEDAASGAQASSAAGRLFAELGLQRRPGQSASILWTPGRIDDLDRWRLQVRGHLPERLFPRHDSNSATSPALSQERIAARLIEAWLSLLRREVWRAS
ncbi:MAG TPA: hypothetical protein VLU25_03930 [Acidobacteriota bacterium]|nr:hypothetical protein [Acidobacteriota bacterium]